MEQIPLDKLAKVYRKIRDRIGKLTQEYETQVEELKAQQAEIFSQQQVDDVEGYRD